MNYPIVNPPTGGKGFREMNKKEAEQHYKWYMDEIPNREFLLKQFYVNTTGDMDDIFDYFPESLIPIWSWYLKIVKPIPKSKEKYEEDLRNSLDHIKPFVLKNEMELGAMQLAFDIGIYFALCLLKYNEKLYWGIRYKPKDFYSVNRPIIQGFKGKMNFDPASIMSTKMSKIISGDLNKKGLYETFHVWIKFIPT